VIVIIAILAAVLLPAYKAFDIQVKMSGCQKNLRQCHSALMAYAQRSDGVFPNYERYYGYQFKGHAREDEEGNLNRWAGLAQVKLLKQCGGNRDCFFCPMDRRYGDPDATRRSPHGELEHPWRSWEEPNYQSWQDRVWVNSGYTLYWGRTAYNNNFRDGREAATRSFDDADLPLMADELFYRYNSPWPNLKGGWHHGGGVQRDDNPDNPDIGLFNEDSSCNTLFLGGEVTHSEWSELEEAGPAFQWSSDCWWLALEPK